MCSFHLMRMQVLRARRVQHSYAEAGTEGKRSQLCQHVLISVGYGGRIRVG